MQMALVIIGGFVVASSPPVARLTRWLASIPKTARGAVAFTAAFATLSSLLRQTIFLWQSLVTAAVLIVVSVVVAYFSAPAEEEARTAKSMGVVFAETETRETPPATPAEKLEESPLLSIVIAVLMIAFLAMRFREKGALEGSI